MYSEEGEKVPLKTTFNPKAAGGNVEKWFIEAEVIMRDTVKDVTKRAFDAHVTTSRIDWILQWPGQVNLSASVCQLSFAGVALIHSVCSELQLAHAARVTICCPVWGCTLIRRLSLPK
jgi:hypothetical protein